ncbi:MAG: rane protein [Fibrobacteres bacterium]|nr:rane protein [Fibrobacterota bacterium]
MNKGLAIVLIVAGVALLFYGLQASHSFSSGVSRFFTGSPTDRTIWLIVAGLVASVAGLFMLVRGGKQ